MNFLKVKSPAKINLYLDVVGKRDDGYHILDMVMVPVSLYDTIILKKATKDSVEFFNNNVGPINTVSKALKLFKDKYRIDSGVQIKVYKTIPSEAGLGGGSSNAASVLMALNKMFKTNASTADLRQLGFSLGADVPFFINPQPARCQGLGEIITEFKIKNKYYCLLAKPTKGCSTKVIYQKVKLKENNNTAIKELIEALESGQDKDIGALIHNDLEQPAINEVEEIKNIKNIFGKNGFKIVMMTGSGSCVFCLSKNKKELKLMQKKIKEISSTYLVKILN